MTSAFRIHGETEDGQPISVVLGAGRHVAGSSSDCQVVVRVAGVSRRHACLLVDNEHIIIEDLDAKNGTFVNARPVHRSEVRPGDRIHLGPAELIVDRAEADDGLLAISLKQASMPIDPRDEDTETRTRRSGVPEANWLDLLVEHARQLLISRGDLYRAVDHLARELDASSVALLEWSGRLQPTVLATSGDLPRLEAARPFVLRSIAGARNKAVSASILLAGAAPRLALAIVAEPKRIPWLLVVAGAAASFDFLPLLEALVQLEVLARRSEPPRRSADERPRLVLPDTDRAARSELMVEVYNQVEQIAGSITPVLITGETGAGKEHVARTLHLSSPRATGPLVAVNCAAIPADLLEAELFGIESGVATGVDARTGQLEQAGGGTLLLDEIGDLSPTLQAKLLRVLDTLQIHPVGARTPRAIDVRLLAATNVELRQRLDDGSFRSDLYYRLAGSTIEVPPLRRRRDDIAPLVEHFLTRFTRELDKPVRGITVKALRVLQQAPWPGNIRQLQHELRRLVTLCPPDHAIDSSLLPDELLIPLDDDDDKPPSNLRLEDHLAATERRLIRLALERTEGNRSRAAELLGISRNGLAQKIQRLALDV